MSSPDILAQPESQAAISRFFYSLAPVTDGSAADFYEFSQQVYRQCLPYLKTGVNLLATEAIDGENNHQNLHRRDEDFDHRATAMVGFDTTWAEHRIFGWQVNYVRLSKGLDDITHGRGILGLYIDGSSHYILARRYDLQGREVSGSAREAKDPRMAAIIANRLIRPLVSLEELGKTTSKFEQQRGELAQKIVKFDQSHLDTATNRQERAAMCKQLADIGFMAINFRLRVNDYGDIVRK